MTPPRVLVVGNFLSGSRANRGVCEELAARLAATGWSVLTTSSEPRRLLRLLQMMRTVWRERNAYDVAQVDVYSGAAFVWAEIVCLLLRGLRKPFVLALHGGNLPNFAERQPRRVRHLLSSAVAVTAPSRYLQQGIEPYRSDVLLLPNAIDVSIYPYRPRERSCPRLVWLRAFHAIYNPMLAVEAVAKLVPSLPGVHLAMAGADAGDGTLQRTRDAIADAQIGDRVELRNSVSKSAVPAWLDAGDIFLNTTNVDNTPVSVIEAMACGLCVVTTEVGGIPHLLEHLGDALFVPPRDPDAMADAIRRLVTEPELAEAMATRARRKAEQFDWSRILPRWQELLSKAAGPSA